MATLVYAYSARSGQPIIGGRLAFPTSARIAIWGQSNAIGRADRSDISATPLNADPGLAAYDAGTFSRVWIGSGSGFSQLQPSANNGADTGQFGPEFGLAVRWMRETTSGNLYIEKEGFSGADIEFFDPSSFVYPQLESRHNGNNAWLSSNGITIAAEMWLWIQGESNSGTSQGDYQAALSALIAARVADGLIPSGSQQVLAQMKVGSGGYGVGVAAAKTAIATASGGPVTTIAMDYYKPDNLHCNGRGQVQLGYDAFEKLFGAGHIST